MSATAVGREEVHYLVHLLSAAALIWFTLHSLQVRHPTELLWAVTARRNASSASAEAVLTLTQRAPACRLQACICNASVAPGPRPELRQLSAAAPSVAPAQQQRNVDGSAQHQLNLAQQPLQSAQQSLEQPRVVMFYHIAAVNNWREVRIFSGSAHLIATPDGGYE